jgi:hypothetical protein
MAPGEDGAPAVEVLPLPHGLVAVLELLDATDETEAEPTKGAA